MDARGRDPMKHQQGQKILKDILSFSLNKRKKKVEYDSIQRSNQSLSHTKSLYADYNRL